MIYRRPQTAAGCTHCRAIRGFTITELLVVIGIIVVLISILIPAVTGVRKTAFKAQSQARLATIANACQNYFNDFKAYPGPLRNDQVVGKKQPDGTPFINQRNGARYAFTGGDGVGPKEITQSENLVLGLMGGLTIKFNKSGANGLSISAFTYERDTVGRGPESLTAVAEARRNKPAYLSNSQWLSDQVSQPAELHHGLGSAVPEFVDQQGVPILYLRANVGRPVFTGSNFRQSGISEDDTLQYNVAHLTPYVENGRDFSKKGTPFTTLDYVYDSKTDQSYLRSPTTSNSAPTQNDPWQPRGKDAFILIAAGIDGVYGTDDDIINPQ